MLLYNFEGGWNGHSIPESIAIMEQYSIINIPVLILCLNQEEKDYLAGYFLLYGKDPRIEIIAYEIDVRQYYGREYMLWLTANPSVMPSPLEFKKTLGNYKIYRR